jgi:ubiquinone biosynthesis protein
VAVKVLRPGIERTIERDVRCSTPGAALPSATGRWQAPQARARWSTSSEASTDELDLLREAANASQLRRNFAGSKMLYVPEVYWPHAAAR